MVLEDLDILLLRCGNLQALGTSPLTRQDNFYASFLIVTESSTFFHFLLSVISKGYVAAFP